MLASLANKSWFTFQLDSKEELLVYGFKGYERISNPYEFTIELVSHNPNIAMANFLANQGLLTILDHSYNTRFIHGQIRLASQLNTANGLTHYEIKLVPRFWFLSQNQNHRIFQNLSMPQIIEKILKEQSFIPETYEFELKENYNELEYCVQYAESDFYFINRLCEEAGIYYYFKHFEDKHVLCFSDAFGGPWIKGKPKGMSRFFPGSGQVAEEAVIREINFSHEIKSDSSSYREWNFEQPSLNLEVSQMETSQELAPSPGGLKLETYQFPHLYQLTAPGSNYVNIQLQRQICQNILLNGQSNISELLPGFSLTLEEHPRNDLNTAWKLIYTFHEGRQPQVLDIAQSEQTFYYNNEFQAIPFETRFIPAIKHPKKRIEGLQSAIVTGPESEEVYVDKYGRVKVHFHWDRLGPMTEKSTCWVRVADGWAGQNFGFIQLPRIGQEVMVEFMEGDPDRPVITGRVYNAEKMPPWSLPSQKTLSGIQSREFQGGQRNQLLFDDTKGQVQAQLSSDHELSQLNLGYLTRVNHVDGRKDFRGEGFELRTDAWGAIRAAKGLHITTQERPSAAEHHKSMNEAFMAIDKAANFHSQINDVAVGHLAQNRADQAKPVNSKLKQQATAVMGKGKNQELTEPHLILSSPVGIAATTPGSSHWHTDEHTAITSLGSTSITSYKSLMATALDKISLFAHQNGFNMFAGKGDVKIQAQKNDLEAIAEGEVRILSNSKKVHISSPEEILLTAGGSYLKINSNGIEHGTSGKFTSKAATHEFIGPATLPHLKEPMPWFEPPVVANASLRDPLWRPLDLVEVSDAKDLTTGTSVSLNRANAKEHQEYTLQGKAENSKYTQICGNKFELSNDTEDQ